MTKWMLILAWAVVSFITYRRVTIFFSAFGDPQSQIVIVSLLAAAVWAAVAYGVNWIIKTCRKIDWS